MARVAPTGDGGPAFLQAARPNLSGPSNGAGGSDKESSDTFKTQSASSSCSTTRAPSSAAPSNNTSGAFPDQQGAMAPMDGTGAATPSAVPMDAAPVQPEQQLGGFGQWDPSYTG